MAGPVESLQMVLKSKMYISNRSQDLWLRTRKIIIYYAGIVVVPILLSLVSRLLEAKVTVVTLATSVSATLKMCSLDSCR